MTRLGKAQIAFRAEQDRQTFGDYYEVVIWQYRAAQQDGLYFTKCALENCLVELGFAAQRMDVDIAEIARERGLLKSSFVKR